MTTGINNNIPKNQRTNNRQKDCWALGSLMIRFLSFNNTYGRIYIIVYDRRDIKGFHRNFRLTLEYLCKDIIFKGKY